MTAAAYVCRVLLLDVRCVTVMLADIVSNEAASQHQCIIVPPHFIGLLPLLFSLLTFVLHFNFLDGCYQSYQEFLSYRIHKLHCLSLTISLS